MLVDGVGSLFASVCRRPLTLAAALFCGCAGGDDGQDEIANEPESGPCGIAGLPWEDDELAVQRAGLDADGVPSVLLVARVAGMCPGAGGASTVRFDPVTAVVTTSDIGVVFESAATVDGDVYHLESVGVDIVVERDDGDGEVTMVFSAADSSAMTTCQLEESTAVVCV